jgi:hypothetical protein
MKTTEQPYCKNHLIRMWKPGVMRSYPYQTEERAKAAYEDACVTWPDWDIQLLRKGDEVIAFREGSKPQRKKTA